MKTRSLKTRRAFTLVEVIIAAAITAVISLSILAAIIYNIRTRAFAREQTQATRLLVQVLEEFRHRQYSDMTHVAPATLILDDNGTPDFGADDIEAYVTLEFYDYDLENPLTGSGRTDLPLDRLLRINAKVEWTSPHTGRFHEVSMVTEHSRSVEE